MARTINVDPTPAAVRLNFWIGYFKPPANKLAPRTSNRLPMMLPVSEALTTSSSPRRSASKARINSAAFPNVAFRSPPIPGPSRSDNSSVDRPINPASGTMAKPAATNRTTAGASKAQTPIAIGTAHRNQVSQPQVPRSSVARIAAIRLTLFRDTG